MNDLTLSYHPEDFGRCKKEFTRQCEEYAKGHAKKIVLDNQKFILIPGAADFSRGVVDTVYGLDKLGSKVFHNNESYNPNVKSVLQRELCQDLIKLIDSDTNKVTSDGLVFNTHILNYHPNLVKNLVRLIMAGFESELSNKLGENFIPVSFSCWETKFSGKKDNLSYKWHVDASPSQYLKVLLYLNDYEEGQGTTAYYDNDASQMGRDLGYSMANFNARVEDLSPLFNFGGISPVPIHLEYQSGDGLIFDPGFTLHKGIIPSIGKSRYVIQVGFMPFVQPYYQVEESVSKLICKSGGFSFPVVTESLAAA